jgi:transcriptional regulator with XRE-family HTH domain
MTRAQRQLCRDFASVIDAGGLRLAPIAKRMGVSRSLVSMLKAAKRTPTPETSLLMQEVIARPVLMRPKKVVAKHPIGA